MPRPSETEIDISIMKKQDRSMGGAPWILDVTQIDFWLLTFLSELFGKVSFEEKKSQNQIFYQSEPNPLPKSIDQNQNSQVSWWKWAWPITSSYIV